MNDGRRIAHSLMAQRAPSFDFFGKAFAWHPRQTLETALAVARERAA
jgi:hypothetical protein